METQVFATSPLSVVRGLRVPLVLAAALTVAIGWGCQPRYLVTEKSSRQFDVVREAEKVLRDRYLQVRVDESQGRVVALTPVELLGNTPVRKLIDVWVLPENGFFMPQVSVRQYYDNSEPPLEHSGPITGRFKIEGDRHPVPAQEWDPIYYDRTLELDLRNAILARLKSTS